MSFVVGGVNSVPQPNFIAGVLSLEGNKNTYRAAKQALALHATPNVIATLVGSATKTIKVTRIRMSAAAATASQDLPYALKKYSTANSSGTATQPAAVPVDSLDAAATGVFNVYTVDPTMGTALGAVAVGVVNAALATVDAPQMVDVYVAASLAQAITLRGVAESIGIDLAGVTLANATTGNIEIEWTEE